MSGDDTAMEEKKVEEQDSELVDGVCCSGDSHDTSLVEVTDALGRTGFYDGRFRDGLPNDVNATMKYQASSIKLYTGSWVDGHWHHQYQNQKTVENGENACCRIEYVTGDVYTGEVVESVRHGVGTLAWIDGRVYNGEWENGERHGKGTYNWPDGSEYVGEFKRNQRHGTGVYRSSNITYEGEWKTNQYHGIGAYQVTTPDGEQRSFTGEFENGKPKVPEQLQVVTEQPWFDSGVPAIYRGLWKNFKPHGNGVVEYQLGAVASYEGCFEDGKYEGEGRLLYHGGDSYVGNFVAGKRDGSGTYKWTDGRQYSGEWLNNQRQGNGVFTWPNGDRYEGYFLAGQRSQEGTFIFGATGASYTGQWKDGQYNGCGKTIDASGEVYEGEFANGLRHGHGSAYDASGKLVFEGEWIDGVKQDGTQESDETGLVEEHSIDNQESCTQAPDSIPTATQKQLQAKELQATPQSTQPASTPPVNQKIVETLQAQSMLTPHCHPLLATSESPAPLLRSWYQPRANSSEIEENCKAVVDQPVTDKLDCSGFYTGIVKDGLPHGVGRLVYTDGKRIHEGFWKNGSKEGHGRCLFFPQQDFHEGEYKDNLRHGPGRYQWKDGREYVGSYENDLRHGMGVFRYPNGERYEG